MLKVFAKDNLIEVINKVPEVIYYSENGACGPSGLFFVLFTDKSIYAYSTYYKKSDKSLIHDAIECVPELRTILRIYGDYNYKRDNLMEEMNIIYLGLGNWGLIHESIFDKIQSFKGQHSYSSFLEYVEEKSGENIKNIPVLVEKSING